jgi:hypothetical protein
MGARTEREEGGIVRKGVMPCRSVPMGVGRGLLHSWRPAVFSGGPLWRLCVVRAGSSPLLGPRTVGAHSAIPWRPCLWGRAGGTALGSHQ